ncbi:MAG: DUF2231 domain-containing protein [Thermomonas sp.]
MKPVHPILVHFPIALLSLSVAADLIGYFADVASLRDTGWWALLGAALGGIATAGAGVYDMKRADIAEEVHHRVHRHMKVGLVLVAAIIGLTLWRWSVQSAGGIVPMFYLDLAVLTVALAAFQGWLGGELVYTDGVFVAQETPVEKNDPDGGKTKDHGHHH